MSKQLIQEGTANVAAAAQPISWLKLPWALLWLLPAMSVVAGLATVYIAIVHGDSMVKDDYYRQGLAYNIQQQADHRAATLQLRGMLVNVNGQWLLTLSAERMPALPDSLQLQLSHPTDKAADQQLTMVRQGAQHYTSNASVTVATNWYLQLQPVDGSWRLRGRWSGNTTGVLAPEIL